MEDLAVLGAKFELQGLVQFERGVDRYINKIGQANQAASQLGTGGAFGRSGQQAGSAFARSFETSTKRLGVGGVNTRGIGSLGKSAGVAFARSFKAATRTLAVGATAVAGVAALGVGAATAVVGSSVNEAAGQQENLGSLASLLGTTREQIPELNQALKDLAVDPNLVVSFNDAAKATELLIKNGVEYQDILDGQLQSTILFQNATGADFGLSADVITDFALQFDVASDETDDLVNKLVGVSQASKFTANDLSLLASQAGAVSKIGVELDDLLLSAALGAESFGSGSDLGTSLKNFYATLTGKSKEAQGAISDLGLDFFDASGNLRDLTDIRKELNDVFTGQEFEVEELVYEVPDGVLFGWKELNKLYSKTNNDIRDYTLGTKGASLTEEKRNKKLAELNKNLGIYSDQLDLYEEAESRVITTTKKLSEEQILDFSQTIFGTDSYRFALDLAATSAEEFAAAQAKIFGTNAAEQAEERSRGLSKALTTLDDTFEQLRADFGAPFLEPLEVGVRAFTESLGAAQPAIVALGEAFTTNFVAPRVEQFTAFVTELGPQLEAAIAGQAFEIDLGSLISISRDSEAFNFDLGGLFTFTNDGEKATYTIFDFVTIEDELGTRTIDVGGFFEFTNDGEKQTYNLLDFVTVESTAEQDKRTIGTDDLFLTKTTTADKTVFNFSDFFTVESPTDSDKTTLSAGDFWTLEFNDSSSKEIIRVTDSFEIVTIQDEDRTIITAGDLFAFRSTDEKTVLKLGDYFTFDTEEGFDLDLSNLLTTVGSGTIALADLITPVDINALLTGEFTWPDLPDLGSLSWPDFMFPELPEFAFPDWPSLPEFSFPALPDFAFPDLPTFTWPEFSFPELPKFSWPALPRFTWPSFPTFKWPAFPSFSFGNPFGGGGVDSNASGTTFFRGGRTRIAELGPELVTLPNGERFLALNNSELTLPRGARIDTAQSTKRQLDRSAGGDALIPSPLFRKAALRSADTAQRFRGQSASGTGFVQKSQILTTQSGAALVALDTARVNLGRSVKALTTAQSEQALLGGPTAAALSSNTAATLAAVQQAQNQTAAGAAFAGPSSQSGFDPILGFVPSALDTALQQAANQGLNTDDVFADLDPFGSLLDEQLADFAADIATQEQEFADNLANLFLKEQVAFLAKGTERFRGGLAIVGEQGPELVRLPFGARVFPTQQSAQLAALMDGMPSVSSDPALVARAAGYAYTHAPVSNVTNDHRRTVTNRRSKTVNMTINAQTVDKSLLNNRAAQAFGGGI